MAEERPQGAAQSAGMQAVYQDNVHAVYAFIYAKVGNREAAEDLTSEVFLSALTHLDLARAEQSIVAWLFCVARHAVADYWRGGPPTRIIALDEARTAYRPALRASALSPTQEQSAARAQAVLAQLPPTYRAVLVCRVLEGLSVSETAQQLGTSVGNVKVLQHRALKRAAEIAENDGDG